MLAANLEVVEECSLGQEIFLSFGIYFRSDLSNIQPQTKGFSRGSFHHHIHY
jgi:hypothetical protein